VQYALADEVGGGGWRWDWAVRAMARGYQVNLTPKVLIVAVG
jgi:surface antigen